MDKKSDALIKADKHLESEIAKLREIYKTDEELRNSQEFTELSKELARIVIEDAQKAEVASVDLPKETKSILENKYRQNLTIRKKYQKIASSLTMAPMIGVAISLFTHSFVANEKYIEITFAVALLLTVFTLLILSNFYCKNLWRPGGSWYKKTLLGKLLLLPIVFMFVLGLWWINAAYALPYLYTIIYGQDLVVKDHIQKDESYSKYSCDHRLEPKSINQFLFHYCISERKYNSMPDGKIEGELFIKKTDLGYIVKEIRLN